MIDIGGGQSEGAGAGDDEHRYRVDESVGHGRGGDPRLTRTIKVTTAVRATAGTKYPATWSASLWIGARLLWASATM